MYMNFHIILNGLLYVWMKNHINFWEMQKNHYQCVLEIMPKLIPNTYAMEHAVYLRLLNHLMGMHHVNVHEHRKATDWAKEIRYLSDVMFPDAEKIILVMDNLNTHKPASLYKTFPPAEARRIIKRLEIHYTPKHGSWLDMAEIELNVMTRQCLSRRTETIERLRKELSSWEEERNKSKAKIKWHFQTGDAREKLILLYPNLTTN